MWRGVHTALVTPWDGENLDTHAWRSLLVRQAEAGVDGVVVAGTTGESPTLSQDERAVMLTTALETVGSRLRVTMGVGTNVTRSSVANVVAAQGLGAHAGMLVLPYYNKPSPAGLRAHVAATAEPGLPLIVYHVPGRTGQRLSPELLGELCSIPGVVACKEATGDITFGQDLMRRCPAPILSGDDFTWLPLLSVGGAGVISVLSNVAPALTVQVWEAWQRRDTHLAAVLHARLYPVVQYLFSESSPGPCKALLAAMDLCRPDTRLPLVASPPPPADLVEGLA